MSIPFKVPLTIYQGATLAFTMTWRAGSAATPVDLTGCAARMQVREDVWADDVLLELSTDNGGIVLGDTAGTVALHASAQQTAALRWDRGVYDLEVVFADGATVRRLMQGTVAVEPGVTRG